MTENISTNVESTAKHFEALLRRQLKLSNFVLKRNRNRNASYTVTTPEGDNFWLYWYDFPDIVITTTIGNRSACGYRTIHESTLRSHVQHCISSMRNDGML